MFQTVWGRPGIPNTSQISSTLGRSLEYSLFVLVFHWPLRKIRVALTVSSTPAKGAALYIPTVSAVVVCVHTVVRLAVFGVLVFLTCAQVDVHFDMTLF